MHYSNVNNFRVTELLLQRTVDQSKSMKILFYYDLSDHNFQNKIIIIFTSSMPMLIFTGLFFKPLKDFELGTFK